MSHFSHPCMRIMAARAYANETGQIFSRIFEFDYFRKTMQLFLMCFKEIIFRLIL